mmetsp:Transcript_81109/g.225657  ORF Transcript_81109/g.225657 Transcript_81109/m.225657 type:complete len:327 (+) Transcript_81109:384-1364(+)
MCQCELHAQEAGHVEDGARHHLGEGDACEEDARVDPGRRQVGHQHREDDGAAAPDEHAGIEEGDLPTFICHVVEQRPRRHQHVENEDQRRGAGGEPRFAGSIDTLVLARARDRRDGCNGAAKEDEQRVEPRRRRLHQQARGGGATTNNAQLLRVGSFEHLLLHEAGHGDENQRDAHRTARRRNRVRHRLGLGDLVLQQVRPEPGGCQEDCAREDERETRQQATHDALLRDPDREGDLRARRARQAIGHRKELREPVARQPLVVFDEAFLEHADVHRGTAKGCGAEHQEVPCDRRQRWWLLGGKERPLRRHRRLLRSECSSVDTQTT